MACQSPDLFLPLLSYVEEIVAHASNVSSLVLGKASGRLLATGGDDCRVNLWSINKPNCIMVSDEPWPLLGLLWQALVTPGPQSGPAYH